MSNLISGISSMMSNGLSSISSLAQNPISGLTSMISGQGQYQESSNPLQAMTQDSLSLSSAALSSLSGQSDQNSTLKSALESVLSEVKSGSDASSSISSLQNLYTQAQQSGASIDSSIAQAVEKAIEGDFQSASQLISSDTLGNLAQAGTSLLSGISSGSGVLSSIGSMASSVSSLIGF